MSARTRVPSQAISRLTLWSVVIFAAVLGVLAAPSAASAQETNALQSIDPVDGATLGTSPEAIVLAFTQELAVDDAVTVTVSCNSQPQNGNLALPAVDADRVVVTVAVTSPLPKGSCVISWRLADADGDTITGSVSTFSIQADTLVTPDPGTGTDTDTTATTDPLIRVTIPPAETSGVGAENQGSSGGALWLGRLISTIGILIVFGGLTLIAVGWPEGPEYVVTVRFMRAIWVAGLLGTLLYLIAYSADVNDSSFGAAMSPSSWLDLKDAGWTGRGALMRFGFVLASGWVAMRPERIIDPATAMWAWLIPGGAVISIALTGIEGPAPIIGFLVGVVHAFGAAVWFGGVTLVARVVLAGPGEDDLVQATRAFSRISMPAIVVTLVTGIIQMIRLDGGNLFSSSHGQVLLLKVVAVAAMLAVSMAVRQQVGMRLDAAHEMTVPLADRFRRAFGAEAALGVVVLAFSGWMLALTPPKVDPLAGETYTREIPFSDDATGIDTTVFIGPATVGRNGLKVVVTEPEEGITNFVLRFTPPEGGQWILDQPIPLTGEGTAVLDDSVGLPFDVPGVWTLELIGSTTGGVQPGAVRTFEVFNADGSRDTIPDTQTTDPAVSVSIVDQTTPDASVVTTTTVPPVTSTSAPPG